MKKKVSIGAIALILSITTLGFCQKENHTTEESTIVGPSEISYKITKGLNGNAYYYDIDLEIPYEQFIKEYTK